MNRVAALLLCAIALLLSGCKHQASETTTTSVSIEGMHCDACAESIHETVIVIPGIELCEVSYENSAASITADSPTVIETAINRIRQLGFTVQQANPS
ncbi:MAG: cation transporter [Planctomycetota bacterium]|nr:cation transporter [Planctomycetota bacterium]